MMGAESDSSLTRARNAVEAGNDRDALNALGQALHRGKKKSHVEMLEEVGALAQIVGFIRRRLAG